MTTLDTLTVFTSRDTATVILRSSNTTSWLQWLQLLIGLATVIVGAVALVQWRQQYATTEWSNRLQFLLKYPRFYTADGNVEYSTKYIADEAAKYELVARLSIAYVDDLHSLGLEHHMEDWLVGSIRVFVYPHRAWFRKNKASYSETFFHYVDDKLKRLENEAN
jgi:hypothetical protein